MLANFLSNIIDLLTAIHKLKVPVHHLNILGGDSIYRYFQIS